MVKEIIPNQDNPIGMSHFSNHQKIKEWKNREFKRKIETLQSRKKKKKIANFKNVAKIHNLG